MSKRDGQEIKIREIADERNVVEEDEKPSRLAPKEDAPGEGSKLEAAKIIGNG
ncbi:MULTISPECIES: hypothetical protein [Rhizobium]|uniref:hypothetical protein n=1 Tax=Rhizobium TaxID=379 RepID=UPI0013EECDF1|nr:MULTISPECIES: hypothetical protein [Rhizobium]